MSNIVVMRILLYNFRSVEEMEFAKTHSHFPFACAKPMISSIYSDDAETIERVLRSFYTTDNSLPSHQPYLPGLEPSNDLLV